MKGQGVAEDFEAFFASTCPGMLAKAILLSGHRQEAEDAVQEVAASVRTRPPTRLRVAAIANATVFEERRLLGFAVKQRCLTIGMPLLLGTTAAELRAVLAHELGR